MSGPVSWGNKILILIPKLKKKIQEILPSAMVTRNGLFYIFVYTFLKMIVFAIWKKELKVEHFNTTIISAVS